MEGEIVGYSNRLLCPVLLLHHYLYCYCYYYCLCRTSQCFALLRYDTYILTGSVMRTCVRVVVVQVVN